MKRILVKRAGGGIAVYQPVINRNDPPGFTEEQALRRALRYVPADALKLLLIEEADYQATKNRTKRSEWTVADFPSAAEIQR